MRTHLDAPGMQHASEIMPAALAGEGLYRPTVDEAKADLRRWSVGRRKHAATFGPVPWQAVATDRLLEELDRLDAEEKLNEGMVVTSAEAWFEQ